MQKGQLYDNYDEILSKATLPIILPSHQPPATNKEELTAINNDLYLLKAQMQADPKQPPVSLLPEADSIFDERALAAVEKDITIAGTQQASFENQKSSLSPPRTPISPIEDMALLTFSLSVTNLHLKEAEEQLTVANKFNQYEFLSPDSYKEALNSTKLTLSSLIEQKLSISEPTVWPSSATPYELSPLQREELQAKIDAAPKEAPIVPPIPQLKGFDIENIDEVKEIAEKELKPIANNCLPTLTLKNLDYAIATIQTQILSDPKSPPHDYPSVYNKNTEELMGVLTRHDEIAANLNVRISIIEANLDRTQRHTYQPENEKLLRDREALQNINIPAIMEKIKSLSFLVNESKIQQAYLQSLDDQILAASSQTQYKFEQSCTGCTHNKIILDKNLYDLQQQKEKYCGEILPYDTKNETKLADLQKDLDEAIIYKTQLEASIYDMETRINEHKNYKNDVNKQTEELLALKEASSKLIDERKIISDQIECTRWYEACVRADKLQQMVRDRSDILAIEENNIILEARRKVSSYELYKLYRVELNNYQKQHALSNAYNIAVDAATKIAAADLYSDYKKVVLLKDLNERIQEMEQQLVRRNKELEEISKYAIVPDIQSATQAVNFQRGKVESAQKAIADLEMRITSYNVDTEIYNKYTLTTVQLDQNISEAKLRLISLNKRREYLLKQIECAKWYEAVERNDRYNKTVIRYNTLMSQLEERAAYESILEKNNNIMEARGKVAQHELYEEYLSELKLYHAEQQSYKNYMAAVEAKAKIEAADLYSDYKKCMIIKALETKVQALLQRLEQLKKELAIINSFNIAKIPCIQTAKGELMKAQQELGRASANRLTAEANLNIRKNWEQNGNPLAVQLANLEKYKNCLTDGSLRLAIVKRVFDKIIQSINGNLAEITDFTIQYMMEKDQIDLFIMERGHKLPIELASGFQKFIISLMFRIAVTMNRCEFLIIDEGFGCLDETNTLAAIEFFANITHCYRFLFIISHVSEMHAALNTQLIINKRGSDSFINNITEEIIPDKVVDAPAIKPDPRVEPQPINGKIACGCGSVIDPVSKKAHERTQKHIKWLNSK